ncbi:MAG: hypothetical protein ABDH91_02710 [Bacteroidia bacterium]
MHVLKELENRIALWTESQLAEAFPQAFLVEARLRVRGPQPEIHLRIDTDKGITLEECLRIHFFLHDKLQSLDWLPENCSLSVGTPALDRPLRVRRQYMARIGRRLRIRTRNGRQWRGILRAVSEKGLRLQTPRRLVFLSWERIASAWPEFARPKSAFRS